MPHSPQLVIGTGNLKKGMELAALFAPVGLPMQTLADLSESVPEVEETGATFAENAALKASGFAAATDRWVVADDSGLSVDALGEAPGVYSARYAGPGASDEENNRKLLAELATVPAERRGARFICHMALSDPSGAIRAESGAHCRGRILFVPRGSGGFGYDPLFEIVEYHRSFAELGPLAKSRLSHRGRAALRLVPQIIALLDGGRWR